MTDFEVTTNGKYSFLGKLKVRSKSVSLINASDLTKVIKSNTKWEVEKQLMNDIASSKLLHRQNCKPKELCFIFQRIANQVSATETLINPSTTEVLVGILIDRISSTLSQAQRKEQLSEHQNIFQRGTFSTIDEFSCQSCYELFYNPITLSCGHSFCQICIVHGGMKTCIVCTKVVENKNCDSFRVNNILNKILQKWHITEWNGRALIADGLKRFDKKYYKEAVNKFSQALEIIPSSHIATLHRAKARYLLNQLDQALEDSIRASILAHKWPEAYYVKGEIFFKLRCFEEALLSLLICLVLDPENAPAKERIHEIIKKLKSSTHNDTNDQSKALPPASPSRFHLFPHKRLFSSSGCGLFSKRKPCEENEGGDADVHSISCSLREANSEGNINKNLLAFKSSSERMALCSTHVLITSELSPNKGYNEIPFSGGLGTFPSIASELESALDSVLLEIDDSATRDLRMFQNSSFDKQLLELVNIEPLQKPRVVNPELVDASEFECSLCMRLYHDPVCTPCGHVFCQLCIERSLDHSLMCPLCKHPMQRYLADNLEKRHPTCDYTIKAIMQEYMAQSYQDRLQQHVEEMSELIEREPIFVCTIAFPSVPCPLHIFEPRYRLMLRRCLDHNEKEFGMCMPEQGKTHHQIGTLLKIRHVRFFPDGRSVVDSIGLKRFQTSDCEYKDGYNVAKVTYIVDQPVSNPEELDKVISKVYAEAKTWFDSLQETVKDRILNHFGAFPVKDDNINTENGPDWAWWILAVLPVEDSIKAKVLGKNVLHERLLIIHRIFNCLQRRGRR